MWPAVLGTAVSHPLFSSHGQRAQAGSQRLLLQESTAQSQLSGPAADTSLSVRYFTPGTSPGSSREARGAQGQQSQSILCKAARDHGEPICLCLSLSIFHRSRSALPGTSHTDSVLLFAINYHFPPCRPSSSFVTGSPLMWNNPILACN